MRSPRTIAVPGQPRGTERFRPALWLAGVRFRHRLVPLGRTVRSLPTIAVLLVLVTTIFASSAYAQGQLLPDRFATTWLDVDFPGGDLDPVFDVSLERCQAICLEDGACRGFTYDHVNGACFPKAFLNEPEENPQAVSGFVTRQSPDATARAQQAYGTLSFLGEELFDEALAQATNLSLRYAANGRDQRSLLAEAQDRSTEDRVAWTAAAVTVADGADAWLAYARALEDQAKADSDRAYGFHLEAVLAATNAALRLPESRRAEAFVVLADALEATYRGKLALRAVERAEALRPGSSGERYARLRDAYGFRVLRTDADTRTAFPRACITFSEPLDTLRDYAPFLDGFAQRLALEVETTALCFSDVRFGETVEVTLRAGLPSASGEELPRDVTLSTYVPDRDPVVRFQRRTYVLPASGPRSIPITTVNAPSVALRLFRVSDRNFVPAMLDGTFLEELDLWEGRTFERDVGEAVWTGGLTPNGALNEENVSLIPLDEMGADVPGVYVLRASVEGADPYDVPTATQWFLVSDVGLTSLTGSGGMHVVLQRLSTGAPVADATVTLFARSNRALAEVTTDASGLAQIPAGLTRGEGASAPVLILADSPAGLALLSLEEPEFDLSDRGVAGRPPAGPIDAFLATDRGVYRPGDTVHVTALLRDAEARALTDVPVTVWLFRPDGVLYEEVVSTEDRAGGHVVDVTLGDIVPRGTWRIELLADPSAEPLAVRTLLVEDFLPERVDVDLDFSRDGPIVPTNPPKVNLDARFLYGVPASNLSVTGTLTLTPVTTRDGWDGYVFGRHDERAEAFRRDLAAAGRTDAEGRLTFDLPIGRLSLEPRPYVATVTTTLLDAGRPVERTVTREVRPDSSLLGVRPAFEGVLAENGEARFDVVLVDPEGRAARGSARWHVDRITTRYQWYSVGGRWDWEPVTQRERVAEGELRLNATPSGIRVPVTWGRYELRVVSGEDPAIRSSLPFEAGWFAQDASRETPDLLEVTLDADTYRVGDVAQLRIAPEGSGVALVSVLTDRVVETRIVEVNGETTVPLTVTDAWGGGAYVTASLLRPSEHADPLPTRSLGVAYASVDPGDRVFRPKILAPEEITSRQPLDVVLEVPGVPDGVLHATLAAVDLGALNVTEFVVPDPTVHYFSQRRLGVALRDAYGRLIDARQGAIGTVRAGGGEQEGASPGPVALEDVLSLFEGPIEVRDGRANVRLDLPPFNGTVRVMTVAWSEAAVGAASVDVLVRDPIVIELTTPRFMAPGDRSRLHLALTHVSGSTGTLRVMVEGPGLGPVPETVEIDEGERIIVDVPLEPTSAGEYVYTAMVTTPDGVALNRSRPLSVRVTDPPVVDTERIELTAGDVVTLGADAFEGFVAGSARATIALGAQGAFDLPGILQRLQTYPYGCTEQNASRLLALVLAPDLLGEIGRVELDDLRMEVQDTVDRIASRQGSDGSFGLWGVGGSDVWLDAYVADVLLRAEAAGVVVPDRVLDRVLMRLGNIVSRAPTVLPDPAGYAYASYVLARAGQASIADLRYYAGHNVEQFDRPLAAAHLAAALASYGEVERSARLFDRAVELALAEQDEDGWRSDYGTPTRDLAAVLTLALEAGASTVDTSRLVAVLTFGRPDGWLSTQEAAWMLRAALAMQAERYDATLDGAPLEASIARLEPGAPGVLRNDEDGTLIVTRTTFGVPEKARPASGNGYRIERSFRTLEGEAFPLDEIRVGDRIVVLLEVDRLAGVPEGRLIIDDALPAGFEIDNANLLQEGDVSTLPWLPEPPDGLVVEARSERFLAAVDGRSPGPIRIAYVLRAVSPGTFNQPAAVVEDMYRPENRAWTTTGRITVRR